MHTDNITFP